MERRISQIDKAHLKVKKFKKKPTNTTSQNWSLSSLSFFISVKESLNTKLFLLVPKDS
jgi:hypothetical protein